MNLLLIAQIGKKINNKYEKLVLNTHDATRIKSITLTRSIFSYTLPIVNKRSAELRVSIKKMELIRLMDFMRIA